ncbi:MAG: protein phosphatase 2C domain-containing protein [Pseudomonadota bacterium]
MADKEKPREETTEDSGKKSEDAAEVGKEVKALEESGNKSPEDAGKETPDQVKEEGEGPGKKEAEKEAGGSGEINIGVFGLTDVGIVREANEDAFLIADLSRHLCDQTKELRHHKLGPGGTLFLVCDGMGGALAGEVASKMATETILEIMEREPFPSKHGALVRRMDSACKEASERIFIASRRDIQKRGMGTTITLAAMIDERLFVAQVGDSRCYIMRLDTIYRITKDQSLMNQLLETGQLKEEEIKDFEYSNVILQAAGTQKNVKPEITYVDVRENDMILLCSDGLHSMIGDDVIAYTLLNAPDIETCAYQVIDLANQAGGTDNISVVVARFTGPGLIDPDDQPIMYQQYFIKEEEISEEEQAQWDFPEIDIDEKNR